MISLFFFFQETLRSILNQFWKIYDSAIGLLFLLTLLCSVSLGKESDIHEFTLSLHVERKFFFFFFFWNCTKPPFLIYLALVCFVLSSSFLKISKFIQTSCSPYFLVFQKYQVCLIRFSVGHFLLYTCAFSSLISSTVLLAI